MIARLLVVRLGSLGDLVHTLPAVNALRAAHPTAQIDWLVDKPHRDFLALVPVISSAVVLEERGVGGWRRALRALRPRKYDVAVDFQGLIKSAALARLSGARRVVGFDRRSLREPLAAAFYTERVSGGAGSHVIRKNLRLAAKLGAAGDEPLVFPIQSTDSQASRSLAADFPRGYAVINPGAAWPNKRWPPDRFGAVARAIRDRHDLPSVVLWGPGEREAAEAVVAASGGAASMAPRTSLTDVIALGRAARLVVSGDTGPLHMLCALGVPAVGLFGPTDPERNGPWDPADVNISRYGTCPCHYERRCRKPPASWCLASITVDEVITAVARRLASTGRDRT